MDLKKVDWYKMILCSKDENRQTSKIISAETKKNMHGVNAPKILRTLLQFDSIILLITVGIIN